ncbi:hypothetical protein QMK19_13960 [Streptomyces sp. H10-C2]|uniref:hypothetical protein n=1 Tax=unclassified Streptomyces TaxID=2593676 RepID=UPI0024BB4532|nr:MULTISPECIES: hypothetical protein [unclassified Streptomyces]MDJ0346324.1 hypothetical protein [Streptomyces sp. PH10-H1]MDJ0370761.1 hypothetical protein [Streptomyces sp. H10-C2]
MQRTTNGDEPVLPDPERVDPAVLTALLARHGWERRGGAPGRYSRWTPPGSAPRLHDTDTGTCAGTAATGGGTGTSLLVPEGRPRGGRAGDAGYADHTDLLGEALTALARSAAPSARAVLLALTVPGDEIRWRREVPRIGDAVPWLAAEQLRAGARAMLMAAARAARQTAGYFGERHAPHAAGFLEQVLVGPVTGGHLLTAYAPVPDGRPATATLLRALQAARDAVDYQRATGGMEAFDAAVDLGVCHELAEALVRLVRGTEGMEVALAWSPAAGPPGGFAARPEPVEFSPGDLPALEAASARYLRREPSVPVRVTGTVVRLRRPVPSGGGSVRLRVLAGADVRQVRVRLDEEAYRIAAHAHLVGLPIRVSGRLESRGGFRRLTEATGVTPVHVDEAERDRLLKSLHGGVDTFEDACGGDS